MVANLIVTRSQPPSRGCELKYTNTTMLLRCINQPPSRGCELKSFMVANLIVTRSQPPSRGCELKCKNNRLDLHKGYASRLRAAVS